MSRTETTTHWENHWASANRVTEVAALRKNAHRHASEESVRDEAKTLCPPYPTLVVITVPVTTYR